MMDEEVIAPGEEGEDTDAEESPVEPAMSDDEDDDEDELDGGDDDEEIDEEEEES